MATAKEERSSIHMGQRLEELEARRAKAKEKGLINNASLRAGASMYFYCKFCGIQTDVLPENYFVSTPKKICDDCQTLIDLGWHDGKTPNFPYRGQNTPNLVK